MSLLNTDLSGDSILKCATLNNSIGSGSNGVVICSTFTRQPPSRRIPLHKKVALKVMSHFWDASARQLLDCERKTLAYLPSHPSSIRVFEEFEETLSPEIIRFLTPAMQQAAGAVTSASSDSQSRKNQTQFFIMEFHPTTLDHWRSIWPSPMPWHILQRISLDLLSIATHMQKHSVGHLDLKLDNILVGYDGRSILTDFGISRIFDKDSNMMLQYREPFGLLMNRLVLAPEVLADYDRATQVWKKVTGIQDKGNSHTNVSTNGGAAAIPQESFSSQEKKDLTIGFSSQSVWSIGVVIYELACGFNHEPTYPEDGGGTRGSSYTLNTLVPLPSLNLSSNLENRFFKATDGSLRTITPRGYPSEFCGLVFSMLDANPLTRVSVEDAFAAIQSMKPSYSMPLIENVQTSSAFVALPDGTKLNLSHEVTCVEKDHNDGQSMLVLPERISTDGLELSPSKTPLVPVLLRHWSGACRLVRVTADLSVHQVAVCWSVGLQINIMRHKISMEKGAVEDQSVTLLNTLTDPNEELIAQCRIFLGGFEAQGSSLISDLIELLQPLDETQPQSVLKTTTIDEENEQWSDEEDEEVTAFSKPTKSVSPPNPPVRNLTKHFIKNSLESSGGVLILDLVPSESETTNLSASYVLSLLDEICCSNMNSSNLDSISQLKAPAPLFVHGDATISPLTSFAEFINDSGQLIPLQTSVVAPRKHTLDKPNNKSLHCALVDMREAILYRSLLMLTGLSNSALRHPNSPFPYQECSKYSVLATLWFPNNHETVAAAVGVLRNVSCTESLAKATAMVNFGAIRSCASAYFQIWKSATEIDSLRKSGNIDQINTSTSFVTISSSPLQNSKFHGQDVRCAEDCILGASNFLRFDELQVHSINVPTLTLALMCANAMDSFPKDQSMQNSASTLLRYMLSMDDPDNGARSAGLSEAIERKEPTVVEALVRAGCMRGLSQAMKHFPTDQVTVENALHIICTLLVFDEYRTVSMCPYKLCAEAVIAVMTRPEYSNNTHVLNLGASALRNLACVTDDDINFTESPAIVVTQTGAATVLEDVMSKHPTMAALQENGRCALYNLLLLGSKDAVTLAQRTAMAEKSKTELQVRLDVAEARSKTLNSDPISSSILNTPIVALSSANLTLSSNPISPAVLLKNPEVQGIDHHSIVSIGEWSVKPLQKEKSSSQTTRSAISNISNAPIISRDTVAAWEIEKSRLIYRLIIAIIFTALSLAAVIGLAITWKK